MVKITYDAEAKALYIYCKERTPMDVAKTVQANSYNGVNLDYDKEGNLLGVEILNLE